MGTDVMKLVNNQYQKVDYIKGDDEVDKETFAKIKAVYPDEPNSGLPLEMKMLRIGISNPQDASFIAYNAFINQCRTDGQAAKAANAAKLALLKQVNVQQGSETIIFYVEG